MHYFSPLSEHDHSTHFNFDRVQSSFISEAETAASNRSDTQRNMFAFIFVLLFFALGFPLSVSALPAPTVAISNDTIAAMAEAMAAAMPPGCGADWISVFPWTDAGYTGEWQPICGAPGVCQNVPAQLNDKISSFGISGPTGRAWCQLFQ